MKPIVKLFILTSLIYSCKPEIKEVSSPEKNLEIEIINSTLSQLIPEYPLCVPPPIINESNSEYDVRLKKLRKEIDSVGKKIELNSQLQPIDPFVLDIVVRENSIEDIDLIKKIPKTSKEIDLTLINSFNNVSVVEINKNKFIDCYTIGRIEYSRMAFNKDSTFAIFEYSFIDGSCMGGTAGFVRVKRKDDKWIIIK